MFQAEDCHWDMWDICGILKIPIAPSQEHHAGSSPGSCHDSCSQLAALLEDELFELQEVGWDLGNWATGSSWGRCEPNMHRARMIDLLSKQTTCQ